MQAVKKISYSLSLFLIIFTLNANLDRIAGTYPCFIQDNADELFSPIHGAIAWESGTIRRIYDFGPMFDVEQAKKNFLAQQKQPAAYEEQKEPAAPQPQDMQKFLHKTLEIILKEAPAVVQLVHLIFHRQALDSVNPADFVVTKGLRELDPCIIALLVGRILVVLEELELDQKSVLEQATSQETKKQAPLTVLENFLKKLQGEKPTQKAYQAPQNIPEKISEILTKNFKTDAKTLFKDKEEMINNWSQLIKNLFKTSIQALLFSRTFPPTTVRLILLALLYQTSHLEPNILATYYKTLFRLDGVQTKKQSESEKEPLQTFTTQKIPLFSASIEKIKTPELFLNQYEQLVYVLLYPHFQVAPYATATLLKQDGSPTGLSFADCMDNSFRNLFNLLAFDGSYLTLAQLQKISQQVNPRLESFYHEPIPLTNLTEQTYHNQWTKVISNLHYVAYVNRTDTQKKENWPGYIKIPSTDLVEQKSPLNDFLTQNNYAIIQFEQGKPEDIITYEIQPSLRNFIIVLDTLLNLNIFKEKLAAEFIKKDFIATYLPTVLEKIGQKSIKYTDIVGNEIDPKDIDTLDLKGDLITITTENFSISVSSGHGQFDVPLKTPKMSCPKIDINSSIIPFSSILLPQDTGVIVQIKDLPNRYLALFSLPLENPDLITKMPAKFFADKPTFDLFLYLAARHPDLNQRQISLSHVYGQYISQMQGDDIDTIINKAINVATSALESKEASVQVSGLRLCRILIEQNKGIERIITIAKENLQKEGTKDQDLGLWLFRMLIEQNKGIERIITIAEEGLQKEETSTGYKYLQIFQALFEKDKGFDQATALATACLNSPKGNLLARGYFLFDELIKKDQNFDQAEQTAKNALKQKNNLTKGFGLKIITSLIKKGKSIDYAISIIKEVWGLGINFAVISEFYNALLTEPKSSEKAVQELSKLAKENQDANNFLDLSGLKKLLPKVKK